MAKYICKDRAIIRDDGAVLMFIAPQRSGPNLLSQQAAVSPHEVDELGRRMAAALEFVEDVAGWLHSGNVSLQRAIERARAIRDMK